MKTKIEYSPIRNIDDLRDLLDMVPPGTKVKLSNDNATCDAERYITLHVSLERGQLIFK